MHYGIANNKYVRKQFNPKIESSYSMYFDLNNIYRMAMSEPLLFRHFERVDPFSVNIENFRDDDKSGYFLMSIYTILKILSLINFTFQ